jgi:hypothetical protein
MMSKDRYNIVLTPNKDETRHNNWIQEEQSQPGILQK